MANDVGSNPTYETNGSSYTIPTLDQVADAPVAFSEFADSIPFAENIPVVNVGTDITVDDTYNGKMIVATADITLTFGTLEEGFSVACVGDGFTITFAVTDKIGHTTQAYEVGSVITANGVNILSLASTAAGQGQVDPLQGEPGKSAYEIAVENGFVGTEQEWLDSLHGEDGAPGADGVDGTDGLSAYEVAMNNGFSGSEEEWLVSLIGAPGVGVYFKGEVANESDLDALKATASVGDAYIVAATGELWVFDDAGNFVNAGNIVGPQGPAGADAYEVWLQQPGNVGPIENYFEDIKGEPGQDITLPPAGEADLLLTSTIDSYEWAPLAAYTKEESDAKYSTQEQADREVHPFLLMGA